MPGDACNTIGHTTNKFATKTNESAMNALMLPKAIKLETKVHAGTQTTNPTQRDAVSNVENVRLLRITGDKSSLCSEEDALEASKDSTSTSLSTPFLGNEGVTTCSPRRRRRRRRRRARVVPSSFRASSSPSGDDDDGEEEEDASHTHLLERRFDHHHRVVGGRKKSMLL